MCPFVKLLNVRGTKVDQTASYVNFYRTSTREAIYTVQKCYKILSITLQCYIKRLNNTMQDGLTLSPHKNRTPSTLSIAALNGCGQ